jgi:hypothetical protein
MKGEQGNPKARVAFEIKMEFSIEKSDEVVRNFNNQKYLKVVVDRSIHLPSKRFYLKPKFKLTNLINKFAIIYLLRI